MENLTTLTVDEVSSAQCGLDILSSKGWLTPAYTIVGGACLNCANYIITPEEMEKVLDRVIVDIVGYFNDGGVTTMTGEDHTQYYTTYVVKAVELEMALNYNLWKLAEALGEERGANPHRKERLHKMCDVVRKAWEKQHNLNVKGAKKDKEFSQFLFKMTD